MISFLFIFSNGRQLGKSTIGHASCLCKSQISCFLHDRLSRRYIQYSTELCDQCNKNVCVFVPCLKKCYMIKVTFQSFTLYIDPVYPAAPVVTCPAACPLHTATYICTTTGDFTDVHWQFRNATNNVLLGLLATTNIQSRGNARFGGVNFTVKGNNTFSQLSYITEPLAESIQKSCCVSDEYSSIIFVCIKCNNTIIGKNGFINSY